MRDDIIDVIYLSIIAGILFILSSVVFETGAHAQTRLEIERYIVQEAKRNGIDPSLALAIAEVESRFNPHAVGSIGEIGLFQLRPEFHPVVPGRVRHNIRVATQYLAQLKRQCAHYGEAYFVCFNYGPSRKLKYPQLFPYYSKVKAAQVKRQGFAVASTERN